MTNPSIPSSAPSTVIVVGPPWPRSGAGQVIQSQLDYYRQRGFYTVFVAVPFHWAYTQAGMDWDGVKAGIGDLGADRAEIAALTPAGYRVATYKAALRHGLRLTALDRSIAVGRSARLRRETIRSLRRLQVAAIHVNYVYTLGFALKLRRQLLPGGAELPILLDTHDIQAHVLAEKGELNPWTRRPDRVDRSIRSEIGFLQKADVLVHLSVDDFQFFQAAMPSKPHVLALPTINEKFVSGVNAVPAETKSIDLLFVGQRHAPNQAAVEWLLKDVWPFIAGRGYTLKIVGAVDQLVRDKLPRLYEEFASCFVGPVADLTPLYRAARCVIAPMISGSGTSVKTIEALAMGKPFVGTSKAFRGMPADAIRRLGLKAYDDPRAFAEEVVRVLNMEERSGALSRSVYDSFFSTTASFAARDEALKIACAEHSPRPLLRRFGLA